MKLKVLIEAGATWLGEPVEYGSLRLKKRAYHPDVPDEPAYWMGMPLCFNDECTFRLEVFSASATWLGEEVCLKGGISLPDVYRAILEDEDD